MATIKELAQGRSDVFKVDPRVIQIKDGWNQREEGPDLDTHIDSIAQSIVANGYMPSKPIEVYMEGGTMYVSDGHCRLRATVRAIEHYQTDIKTIPVINVAKANDADRMLSQITSNSGKPLTPFEQAKVYDRLLKFGWEAKDIAIKAGKSTAHVSQVLDYLTLPENIKLLVISGQLSGTLAIKMFKEANGDAGKVIEQLKEGAANAQSQGRTRVMPKDMSGNGQKREKSPGIRKLLKDVFETADVVKPSNDDGMVLIRMTTEDWENISGALGIDIDPSVE